MTEMRKELVRKAGNGRVGRTMAMVMAFWMVTGGSVMAQNIDIAYVPFIVNVNATVKAERSENVVSMNVTANTADTLKIPLVTSTSVIDRQQNARSTTPTIANNQRGRVSLSLPGQNYKTAEISLYSINGRRILHTNASASEAAKNISRPNLAAGAYLLTVKGVSGHSFTNRMTHSGGALNINVTFGNESFTSASKSLSKQAATAAVEDWAITISAPGRVDSTYTLNVVVGMNTLQNIVLMPESGGDNIEKVTITYNINGGTGITPAPQTVNVGDRVLIASGSGFSRSGFNFNGWNTNSSGTGDSYSPPGSITPTRNITLFAYWSIIVTYNINGGSGTTPSSSTIREGGSTTLANRDYISRSGFSFGGWNTNSSGTGTNYHSKATFTPTNNVTLFAKWVAKVGREGSFTDERDGQIYRTVTIGNQTWMAENLNWAGYRGDLGVCYANNPNNCDVYGRLYNWSGATGKVSSCYSGNVTNCLNSPIVSGNCPDGWYVPRGTEWLILGEFVGSPSRPKLSSTTGWGASVCNGLCLDSPSTDDFGFSALPGGFGDSDGFSAVGVVGRWWNANSNMESHASSAVITPNAVNVTTDSQRKTTLFSLRCIAD